MSMKKNFVTKFKVKVSFESLSLEPRQESRVVHFTMLTPAYQTIEEALHHARTPFPRQQTNPQIQTIQEHTITMPTTTQRHAITNRTPSTKLSMEKQQKKTKKNKWRANATHQQLLCKWHTSNGTIDIWINKQHLPNKYNVTCDLNLALVFSYIQSKHNTTRLNTYPNNFKMLQLTNLGLYALIIKE